MTDAQYNEVMDLLHKVERLVRDAAPTVYLAPLRAPEDHIWQTPAAMYTGTNTAANVRSMPYDWHTSGYISPAEAHG